MSKARDSPAESKFKQCESTALEGTTWQIHPGLKKFSPEEAVEIITSHGGTIDSGTGNSATHELKYASETYGIFGPGKSTIYEPGFLGYVRSQVMYKRINPKEVDHYSLEGLAFIFAGTMPWLQKGEYKELVEEFGGRLQKKVNTKTNYVVLGYKDIPDTVTKIITELGVKVLDEDGFIELLRMRKAPALADLVGMDEGSLANTDNKKLEYEEAKTSDKENAGKSKTKTGKKTASAGMKKKDVEKQNPVKKVTGVAKHSGGEAKSKVQKEQWAGRLRSNVGGGGGNTSTV